jgi:hypothetical protein
VKHPGWQCFTVDRPANFGEDTARSGFIETFSEAETRNVFPPTGNHISVAKNND